GSDICLARYGGDGATGVPTPANDAGSSWARAYPSPFRSTTAVEFSQPAPGPVSMDVYDARGARVTTLVDGVLAAGEHRAPWSGRDDAGRRVAPGVYFVRLRGDHGESATKVVRVD
ncbi:MAG TPA: FlgD immunoglobulin-like domain containing protein, partial [bacterium]|nr:FlgD immunoglobulin-like domain containing protein [bacterium]